MLSVGRLFLRVVISVAMDYSHKVALKPITKDAMSVTYEQDVTLALSRTRPTPASSGHAPKALR